MPPRKYQLAKGVVRIDPKKHDSKIKEIEEKHRRERELAELEEEMLDEEEMGEEEEEESDWSDIEPALEIGRIDLSFPEYPEEFADAPQCYPPSYYTLSPKERLLLLYAENFRKQFVINFPRRRPLVLALPNECNVQKFVCTTIRPTAFLQIPLIRDDIGCAEFAADYTIYEPLEDLMKFPTRLISPTSLLRRRRGNSFELSTLLCSMLIGAGYPAMVVSGVARAETVLNDQRNVPFPHEIVEIKTEPDVKRKTKTGQKYKLRPMPDLESHLEENMAEMIKQKAEEEMRARLEAERKEREDLELVAVDKYHYRRTHAWVVIVDNAPWSIKPPTTHLNQDGDTVPDPPSARFIEPSTGFVCEGHCKQYILIDSVWNEHNYYVNMQQYQRVTDIRWDLRDTNDWEHLLPGEPPEMRQYAQGSDENIIEPSSTTDEEKHLDTIRSWVMKLHIGLREFEERFPKAGKIVRYHRAIHERFSPYSQRDGKTMQVTLFADDEYLEPTTRWEYYEHRGDILEMVKYFYDTEKTEETFGKGRNDCLRFMEYATNPKDPKMLHFYPMPRLDSLKCIEVLPERIAIHYADRGDRIYYQEFEFKPSDQAIKKMVEKLTRKTYDIVPASRDIAVRTFLVNQKKIQLKFHYERGALTSSWVEFAKPPKPDYGQEIKFDQSLTKSYKANISDPDFTPLELYRILLEQLKYEEVIKKRFEKIQEEIASIFDLRRYEMRHPILKFRIFDPLRNAAARKIRMQQNADEEEYKRDMASKPADFLAPYLVPYKDSTLTYEESWAAYNACLHDLKTRFVNLLNDLQRQYEDLTTEARSLKRFLNKFEDQFDNYDYEKLVKEQKSIELNKRMVQQRLTLTHEESQKKYEVVKASLLKDPRLNLRSQSMIDAEEAEKRRISAELKAALVEPVVVVEEKPDFNRLEI